MASSAHNVSQRDAAFVQSNQGTAIAAFMYLGAKHMVTGYDHLAFLVGVIFFLYRLKDVVSVRQPLHVGHSITLLAGVLGGIHANSNIVDAIIGFSVVYKAFDNMDGFKRFLGVRTQYQARGFDLRFVPRLRPGHQASGARSLQERTGDEHRQFQCRRGNRAGAGLTAVFIVLSYWRTRSGFLRHAFATNTVLMTVASFSPDTRSPDTISRS